jgi:hypothetical protein
MKKLFLLSALLIFACSSDDDSENNPLSVYTIEGKWIWSATASSSDSNTMYLFEDGIRYTYYCTSEISDDCQSLFESFQANDGNHIPGINPYTYENDTLRVDLHFGNELVKHITYECDGGKLFMDGVFSHLWRLNSGCE